MDPLWPATGQLAFEVSGSGYRVMEASSGFIEGFDQLPGVFVRG